MDALDGSFFNYTEFVNGEADDNLSMDIQAFIKVLDEDCNPSESSAEDSLMKNVSPGESGSHDNSQPQSGTSVPDYEHGNEEPFLQTCSPLFNLHGNYSDPYFVDDNDVTCYTGRMGVSGYSIPTHSVEPSFSEVHLNSTTDFGDNSCQDLLKGESESQLKHEGEDVEYGSHYSFTGGIERNSGHYGCIKEDTRGATFMDSDRSSHIGTLSDSTIYQGSNVDNDFSNYFPSLQLGRGTDCNTFFAGSSLGYPDGGFFPHLPYKEEMITNMKEEKEFLADTAHGSSNMHSSTIGGTPFQDTKFMSSDSENSSFFGGNVLGEDKEPMQLSAHDLYMLYEDQAISIKHERDEPVRSCPKFSHADNFEESMGQDLNQMPGVFSSVGCQSYDLLQHGDKNTNIAFDRVNHHQDIIDGASSRFLENVVSSDINASEKSLPYPQVSVACEKQFGFVGGEGDGKMIQHSSINCNFSKVSTEYSQRDFLKRSHVEDDSDVCIIEDISHPAPKSQSGDLRNSLSLTQSSTYADSQRYMLGGARLKARDESYILQVALQDLSQPKAEISPPDGLLAVPLLRHQRIALSWMVQKERSSSYCSGGILADDQGLGKTVSTIALMLMERPPVLGAIPQKGELETLSLDEDDDVLPGNDEVKKETSTCLDMPSRCPMKRMNLVVQPKGRPSAGTLIVCPTSVLRQWAEELHNKVTSKANFSVLVYHGSSRTKDPYELVKYDVVLTTYSIVSMEVPKQPLVDKDDEEKGSSEDQGVPSMALPSSRKRKNPPSSSKSSKKGLDGKLLEVVAGPLAKVAWFRVVLDEAQSIKNHRTQVARACWGLRAKRRWCLSGTPIQNAIDDLYSYFRFLRYDPYAVYTSFCSTIKIPINRNPTKGYRKLQAVLKTIMLRRTKGTLLDGEPIINLPPKSVELKKVDFSKEERDFYSRLEADSRAQFQEYADAGTVKQNYVNILLMLLRLRQACDHPLLVRHYDSNTLWRSSVEIAKKLPREKQIGLLKCLEASLALCGICNDAPEDAVVSVCGHVFCNQCICEHLTGEDNQCPATNCRVPLSMSSVFTKGTLNCSLSDQADCNKSNGCSGSEIDGYEPFSQDMQYDSSKIKAALEVLHSLCNPQGRTSTNTSTQGTFEESSDCPGSSSDVCNDHQNQNLSGDRSFNESIVVVREKAIVFSQWTRMLDLLEGCLKNSSIQYRRLDGTMSVIARDKAVKDFNTLPEVTVMIMSLKAASLGLNMVAACHVLLLDLWWNPTTEDQAIDRAHRIGQTRPVTVLRLTVRDTVEDRILALQQKKRKMVASAFGEDGTGGRQSRLTVDDLKYLFMM